MSVEVTAWVWRCRAVKGNERWVLMAIADSAEDDGANAWPSVRHLADKTMLSEATVHRCIRSLEAKGVLAVERNAGGRRDTAANRRPNRYAVLMKGLATNAHHSVDNPVGNSDSGVSNCDPNPNQGCQTDPSGVSKPPVWGVTGDTQSTLSHPETSTTTHAITPSVASTAVDGRRGGRRSSTQTPSPASTPAAAHPGADQVMQRLGTNWPLGADQRRHITRGIAAALGAGWPPYALAELLGSNRDGVRSPYAVLQARLADLPPPPGRTRPRPQWCGQCDQETRLDEFEHNPRRCPRCHPLTRPDDAAPAA